MDGIIKYVEGVELEPGKIYQADNGFFRLADNKLFKAIVPIKMDFGLEKLEPKLFDIKLPKIPYDLFTKIHAFFKKVYDDYKSEVAILLWYNFGSDIWMIEVPKQTVSGASVNYERDEELSIELTNQGFLCVGSIHSHCEMGAFHSGVDDADEYSFDGLHITIGKVKSGPEFAQRYIIKEESYKIDSIGEVVDMPFSDNDIEVPDEWNNKVSKHKYSTYYDYKKDVVKKYNGEDIVYDDDETTKMDTISKLPIKGRLVQCPVCKKYTKIKLNMCCTKCSFPLYENPDDYEQVDEEEVSDNPTLSNLNDYIC